MDFYLGLDVSALDSQYSNVRVPPNHPKSLINARLPGYLPRGSDSLGVG